MSSTSLQKAPPHQSASTTTAYLTYPVSHVVSGLYRRFTDPSPPARTMPSSRSSSQHQNGNVYTPPLRTASPYSPPPLTPLTLHPDPLPTQTSSIFSPTTAFPTTPSGDKPSPTHLILTPPLAEEIRLLVPPRLQLVTDWSLAFALDRDGVSLATLYKKCAAYRGRHNGFVLVVKDGVGGTFGAFLTELPRVESGYYGTGECFLWRASIVTGGGWMGGLPPPPSEDTTMLGRSTTIVSPTARKKPFPASQLGGEGVPPRSRTSTPEQRIRFKAFPYSGVNDYMMFCEAGYLSVGGGDGRYGLWLDSVLERGVSSHCLTFGNEALSEEGEKFEIVGVEVWYLGI